MSVVTVVVVEIADEVCAVILLDANLDEEVDESAIMATLMENAAKAQTMSGSKVKVFKRYSPWCGFRKRYVWHWSWFCCWMWDQW